MCVGAPEWPNKFKLQHLKFCCRFCYRRINWRIFCDKKICHYYKKRIRINGTPTAHYTSKHEQYNSHWNFEWHNQATAIARNKYAILLDSWPKNLKKFLIIWKFGQENLADYFTKKYSAKHHKRVHPIYIKTDNMTRWFLIVLLGCVDPEDSKMEESYNTFPITRIAWLRGARTQTMERQNIERHRM